MIVTTPNLVKVGILLILLARYRLAYQHSEDRTLWMSLIHRATRSQSRLDGMEHTKVAGGTLSTLMS